MNVATWLARAGQRHHDKPAVAVGSHVARTYGELAQRAASLAHAMQTRLGLSSGDRVAIIAENHPAYLEALHAIWWGGMIAVPIDSRLHPAEVAFIVQDAGARLLFVSPTREPDLDSLAVRPRPNMIVLDSREYHHLAELTTGKITPRGPQDGAWLFYTSGTTGRPKGALLTHRNLTVMSLAHLTDVDPTKPGDTLIHGAPLSHASGLLSIPHVAQAGINVIPESGSFDPAEIIALTHHWRRASLFAAPTMVRRLVDHDADLDRGAVRSIVWGGAPMHVADAIRALDFFGPCLAQVYGQGETPMTITVLSKSDIADRHHPGWADRLASAGTPRCVVEVIVADDNDQPCPPGELGEVLVRGDTVMAGYWQNPTATDAALRGGWLHTGDIGVLDQDGYLTLKDRSKDLIISGGLNIYPREVEEILAGVAGVQEVSVIGRPDPEWGEIVVAYIAGTADRDALDRACLAQIARFKRPRDYVHIEALPKSNNGKILKTRLRELDAARHTSPPAKIRS